MSVYGSIHVYLYLALQTRGEKTEGLIIFLTGSPITNVGDKRRG